MTILYTGSKSNLYVGEDTSISKKDSVDIKVEELKDISSKTNDHIKELAQLLSPQDPHFSYIFPEYTISNISQATLTENFIFNSEKVSELNSMPFTHQVEVFSSVTQNLKQTYEKKVKNLPNPLNSTEIFPSNQEVIDRTLELAHNLPTKVADTSDSSPNKLINKAAFESFSSKLSSWKDDFSGFKSSFSRKIEELIGEIKEIPSQESKQIFDQTAVIKKLESTLGDEIKKINFPEENTLAESKEILIEKTLKLNKQIEIEKVRLAEIEVPVPTKIVESIENNKEIAMKFFDVNNDSVTKIENLVTESFLGGKVPILDWAKEKVPTLPEIENKVSSILSRFGFNTSVSKSPQAETTTETTSQPESTNETNTLETSNFSAGVNFDNSPSTNPIETSNYGVSNSGYGYSNGSGY